MSKLRTNDDMQNYRSISKSTLALACAFVALAFTHIPKASASLLLEAVAKNYEQYETKYVYNTFRSYFETYPSKAYKCNTDKDIEVAQCASMLNKLSEYAGNGEEAEAMRFYYKLMNRSPFFETFAAYTEIECDQHGTYKWQTHGKTKYFFEDNFDQVNEKLKKNTITEKETQWLTKKAEMCGATIEEVGRVLDAINTDPNFALIYNKEKEASIARVKTAQAKQKAKQKAAQKIADERVANFEIDGLKLGSVEGQKLKCTPKELSSRKNMLGMELKRIDVGCAYRTDNGRVSIVTSSDKKRIVDIRRVITTKASRDAIMDSIVDTYGEPDESSGRYLNWGYVNKKSDNVNDWTGSELSIEISSCYDSWTKCSGSGYEIEAELTNYTELGQARREGKEMYKKKNNKVTF